jgi:hypothetical protein
MIAGHAGVLSIAAYPDCGHILKTPWLGVEPSPAPPRRTNYVAGFREA